MTAKSLLPTVPSGTAATDPDENLLRHLEELLTQVSALATRLRQDERKVQAAGDLPVGGTHVLRLLSERGTLTVPQIARLNCTSRQNIQILVNRLEKEGCVESVPNPAHKRSELVRLTSRGQASLTAVVQNGDSYKEKLMPRLSREELVRASELLRSIREALGPARPSSTPGEMARTGRFPASYPASGHKPGRVPADEGPIEEDGLPVSLL